MTSFQLIVQCLPLCVCTLVWHDSTWNSCQTSSLCTKRINQIKTCSHPFFHGAWLVLLALGFIVACREKHCFSSPIIISTMNAAALTHTRNICLRSFEYYPPRTRFFKWALLRYERTAACTQQHSRVPNNHLYSATHNNNSSVTFEHQWLCVSAAAAPTPNILAKPTTSSHEF